MSKVKEIKTAIEKLTWEERAELNKWLYGWEDDEWDQQMAEDVESGKLDAVLKRVDDAIERGDLREFPP